MRKLHRTSIVTLLLCGLSIPAMAQGAAAQSSGSDASSNTNGLSDIVVTATRRATNVQDVPFSITAVSGAALRDRGITDPRQLASLAPSLYVDQGAGNGNTHVGIRGLSSTDFSLGTSSPVAIYIDDVYQPFGYGIGVQTYDLGRIEVLRGPQGTLFGKNTTGGALLYYAQTPTDRDEGYFTLDGGGGAYSHGAVEGAFNKRLTDTLAMRISLRADHRGNNIRNLSNGDGLGHSTSVNGRVQLAWRPDADTTIVLKLSALRSDGDPGIGVGKYIGNPCLASFTAAYFLCSASGTPTPESPGPTKVYLDNPVFERFHNYAAVLKVDRNINDFTVTSISSVQKGNYAAQTNDDGTAGDYFHTLQKSRSWQISEELRLATPVANPLHAVFGGFAMYDHINVQAGSGSTHIDPFVSYIQPGKGVQGTTTLALFGNATYDFSRMFSLTGGLRYSIERKSIRDSILQIFGVQDDSYLTYDNAIAAFPGYDAGADCAAGNPFAQVCTGKHTWRRLTWDVTGNFKPAEGVLLYGKIATGFRSGGYPVGLTYLNSFVQLKPERATLYEIGLKSEWFNHVLRVNTSIYQMDYKDQQVNLANPIPGSVGTLQQNAASSRSKGVDLEIAIAPSRAFQINGSVGYNSAKYRRYLDPTTGQDFSGNTLPTAPRWTASGGATYVVELGDSNLSFDTNWTYRSRIFYEQSNRLETSDSSKLIGNAQISYGPADKGWTLTAYVNNLTNRAVKALAYSSFVDATNGFSNTTYNPKRTWGLRGTVNF